MESALEYYKYGYNFDFSELNKAYLILIIGNEICIDIICETFEIIIWTTWDMPGSLNKMLGSRWRKANGAKRSGPEDTMCQQLVI